MIGILLLVWSIAACCLQRICCPRMSLAMVIFCGLPKLFARCCCCCRSCRRHTAAAADTGHHTAATGTDKKGRLRRSSSEIMMATMRMLLATGAFGAGAHAVRTSTSSDEAAKPTDWVPNALAAVPTTPAAHGSRRRVSGIAAGPPAVVEDPVRRPSIVPAPTPAPLLPVPMPVQANRPAAVPPTLPATTSSARRPSAAVLPAAGTVQVQSAPATSTVAAALYGRDAATHHRAALRGIVPPTPVLITPAAAVLPRAPYSTSAVVPAPRPTPAAAPSITVVASTKPQVMWRT